MKTKAKYSALTAVFAALIFAATSLLHIGIGNGYVHLGDSIIYIAAAILPLSNPKLKILKPYAMIAAGIGGAFSDLFAGYIIYIPATFVIKMLLTLAFDPSSSKIVNTKSIIASVIAIPITAGGYFAFEAVIYGVAAAVFSVWANVMQAVASGILFVAIGVLLDRFGFKERLGNL